MKSITLDAALVRAAMTCQASIKTDNRYYLDGIFLGANGDIVGTNGHVLFKSVFAYHTDDSVEMDVIIRIDGKIPLNAETVTLTFPDMSTPFKEGLRGGGVAETNKGKQCFFSVVEGKWKFPQYDQVIPADTLPTTAPGFFGVNTTYLAKVQGVFGKGAAIKIQYGAHERDALRLTCRAMPDAVMVIMPLRL